MPGVLLDTCAVIWLGERARMRQSSLDAIADSAAVNLIYVSPFTAWELGLLVARGRLSLPVQVDDWLEIFISQRGITLADLGTGLLVSAHSLPGSPPNDPADRIIIATARAQKLAIVTRDRRILDYGAAGHVQTVLC